MFENRRVLIALLLFLAVSAAAAEPPVTVTIYNTGDLHCQSGHLPRIAGFIRREKQKDPTVLFVDAGDFLKDGDARRGSTRGEAMIHIMALCGYDAITLGNHDYCRGMDWMLAVTSEYPSFRLGIANVKWEGEYVARAAHIPRYRIFDCNGAKVAVIPTASHLFNHVHGKPFPLVHEREALNELIPKLRKEKKADIVVAITHLWDHNDRRIINWTKENPPDVIIGAHTHAQTVQRHGPVLLVKSGWSGTQIGKVTIQWDGEKVTGKEARMVRVGADWPVDEAVAKARDDALAPKAPVKVGAGK